ncbi:ABC transporter ATP-binding protein [Cellulomonas cellasea]|uniref:Multidrug ABC transporter ATPase n=2 Tax=Cellulomonas cellasea TaxID=43670 RepID=A0A0A0BCE2_9CELL|nr:ABC transporter ATP-binding protein [Cellulomonas cellasea]KGM02991.1 multidrug ABC transporter ATPase [Cellulomonas cellasea DSM 20118]
MTSPPDGIPGTPRPVDRTPAGTESGTPRPGERAHHAGTAPEATSPEDAAGGAAVAGSGRGRPGTGDAALLRRIGALLAPHRGALLLVALSIVVASVLGIVTPFLTQRVFDDALFPVDGSGVDLPLLTWLVAAMIVIPLLSAAIGVGQTYLTTKIGNLAMAELRGRLFEHLERMELAFFTATKTGSIQSRLANDVGGVRSVLTTTASSILSNTVTVLASLVAMLLLSWQLTVVAVALMPVFVVLQRRVGARRQVIARQTQESLSDMTAITEEALSVSGVLLTKVFNRSDTEIARYRAENDRQVTLQVRQAMAGQGFFGVVTAFMAITPALVYLVAGYMITGRAGTDTLTAGTLVAFSTLQARLLMPVISLMRVALDVQTSLALFRRIFEYLDLTPAITDRPGAVHLDPEQTRGRVELDEVWFRYPPPPRLTQPPPAPGGRRGGGFGMRGAMAGLAAPSGGRHPGGAAGVVRLPRDEPEPATDDALAGSRRRAWAVRDVSLVVEPGQLAAFVGPSGAGKTTLSYLVPRLYEVDRGAVRVDGHDVRDLTLSSLADTVGMVTQDPYLFHATIADNLRYARPDATDDELVEACRAANIHDRIEAFEHGYRTLVGERGYRLSGGEKQRIAIARVLLKDPRVLILDEATSALDTASERLVQSALARAVRQRTTLAIAHRLSTIRDADVIFVVDDGRVVERGSHDELVTAPDGLYARLYAEQFGGGRVEARFSDGVMFTDGVVLAQPAPPHA